MWTCLEEFFIYRWEELQKPPEVQNPGNVPRTTIAAEVVVIDQNRPSTSANVVALPAANRNKRHISEVSTESSRAKRLTPTKTEKDQPPVAAAAMHRVRPASESNQVAPVTQKLDHPPRRPIAGSSIAQGAIRANHAGTSSQTVHVIDVSNAIVISPSTSGNS